MAVKMPLIIAKTATIFKFVGTFMILPSNGEFSGLAS